MSAKEVAATAIGNLLLSDPTQRGLFLELRGMRAILRGIEFGSESVQEEASHALLALVLDSPEAVTSLRNCGGLETLASALEDPSATDQTRDYLRSVAQECRPMMAANAPSNE